MLSTGKDLSANGESRRADFTRVLQILDKHNALNDKTVFVDVGSGLGFPSLHLASDRKVGLTIGIENDHRRYLVCFQMRIVSRFASILLSKGICRKSSACTLTGKEGKTFIGLQQHGQRHSELLIIAFALRFHFSFVSESGIYGIGRDNIVFLLSCRHYLRF